MAIVGGGLAGLSTAVELLDQGYEVDIYEQRPFIGGKVASYKDRQGNHVEMGLHVFFGCAAAGFAGWSFIANLKTLHRIIKGISTSCAAWGQGAFNRCHKPSLTSLIPAGATTTCSG